MFLKRLQSGFLLFETQQGLVRIELSLSHRIYLLWTFRNFRQLPIPLLNPRQRTLVNALFCNNVGVVWNYSDKPSPVIGVVENFVPPAVRIDAAPAQKPAPKKERQIRTGRVSAPFNPSRSVFSVHCTGLTASPDRIFHPLRADRRNAPRQLCTTRVSVLDLPATAPVTKEAEVTALSEVVVGPAAFDEAKGAAGSDLQQRNLSRQVLRRPITLRASNIQQTTAGRGMQLLDAKNSPEPGWTFAGKPGSRNRLEPKDISERIRVETKTSRKSGLDGAFEFAVMENVSKAGAGNVKVLVDTELGEIELEIDAGRAPLTAANFLNYVAGRYFDGGSFVRTLTPENQHTAKTPIEMIQAVVAAKEKDAFPAIALERTSLTGLKHLDGTVSMARGEPDSATSSFFICIGDQPALDFGGSRHPDGQGFAPFGKVIRGMDIVRKIHMSRAQGEELIKPIRIPRIAQSKSLLSASSCSVPEGDAGVQRDNSDLTCLGGVGRAHPSNSKSTFSVAVGKGNDAAGTELDLEAVQ
jgi:peptidyl-prolyl cis-trans isomerase A (cyclophilin A)